MLANFGNPGEQEYRFKRSGAFFIRMYPSFADQPRIRNTGLRDAIPKVKPMAETLSGISTVNDRGAINLDPHGDGISSFTQVFPTGELWGVNERAFTSDQANRIVAIAVEKLFVATLENYLNVYRDDFSFTPPFTLEMGATGLAGKVLSLPSLTIRGANDTYGPIRTDSFSHTYQLDTYDRTEWIGVLREFFIELYDLASISRADALQDQHVAAHGLPPR